MIGYFSLSVPSGLSIYWFTNNLLSTTQQVWLRKMGGARRSFSHPAQSGERFKQLKEEERKKLNKALPGEEVQVLASTAGSDDNSDEDANDKNELEEAYSSSTSKQLPDYFGPRKGKRSKRKRTVQ